VIGDGGRTPNLARFQFLDPASRDEVLRALAGYKGAVVLVTHDEGAVDALQPEKVLLLPDGVEDMWTSELADLVALA